MVIIVLWNLNIKIDFYLQYLKKNQIMDKFDKIKLLKLNIDLFDLINYKLNKNQKIHNEIMNIIKDSFRGKLNKYEQKIIENKKKDILICISTYNVKIKKKRNEIKLFKENIELIKNTNELHY